MICCITMMNRFKYCVNRIIIVVLLIASLIIVPMVKVVTSSDCSITAVVTVLAIFLVIQA